VYSLYEQYATEKRQRQQFDLVDALQHIHLRLSKRCTPLSSSSSLSSASPFVPIDFIYCDEVQDLLPGQIALLKFLHVNSEHGFVLAGDTAQVCDET
jgi:superfamily I DNA/RNA helicase